MTKSIAVAKGDGIGKEIMDVVIDIFQQLQVPLNYHYVEMGKDIFMQGHKMGMTDKAKQTVEELGVLFKGPMETPKGSGNRSINVTARKMWATFANCRRFKTLPGVDTIFSKAGIPIDLTIIRENLEDTYGGVEHLLTPDLAISRKFTSAPGSHQIVKYAFDYAVKNNISSVVCGHKANIMKMTDGMYLEIFYEIAKDYPNIKASDVIVDDLCMKLVTAPNNYELIVLPNLQGDIVSDLCAGLVGGLGFAPSTNIGNNIAIFEAVHGTAPDIVGKNVANPTALLMSGLMMLNFLGLGKQAKKIELALLQTLKDKIHTPDLKTGNAPVSTQEYGKAIIERALAIKDDHPELQNIPESGITLGSASNKSTGKPVMLTSRTANSVVKGLDVFIESVEDTEQIAGTINLLLVNEFQKYKLEMIANRGANVFPNGSKFVECVNSYTIRILCNEKITEQEALTVANMLSNTYKILSLEILREFENKLGYSVI
ncbi:isocitrate/isopropylmalate family dehydrogenase [Rickettsiales bacterium LUAb2]